MYHSLQRHQTDQPEAHLLCLALKRGLDLQLGKLMCTIKIQSSSFEGQCASVEWKTKITHNNSCVLISPVPPWTYKFHNGYHVSCTWASACSAVHETAVTAYIAQMPFDMTGSLLLAVRLARNQVAQITHWLFCCCCFCFVHGTYTWISCNF